MVSIGAISGKEHNSTALVAHAVNTANSESKSGDVRCDNISTV